MEVYKAETVEVFRRYRARLISRHACIIGLDAAVAGLVPRIRPDELPALKALLTANNKALMEEATLRIPTRAV